MSTIASTKQKALVAIIAVTGWIALGIQFYQIIQSRDQTGFSTLKTTTNFFSYFTILSNLLVTICTSTILFIPSSRAAAFFSKYTVQSAIALYIFIVGLVYNLVLRGLFPLSGTAALVNELLHVVIPVLYVVYWFLFTPNQQLQWKHLLPWMIFPGLYLAYSLLRGPVADWYPYPFLHAGNLGYGKVLINSFFVVLAFVIGGIGLIGLNRAGKR